MKRTYQGYSGSGQTNHNLPAAPLSYPPLPSGAPPPQPATSSSGPPNPSAVSNNPQYQTSTNPIPLPSSSQPYQYNSQYAAAAPYGQYPGYPPQQQAGQPYTAPIGPVAPGIGHYGYTPQLPQNPQQHQHQQAPHQQPQQPQHPAFPNYGYGATPGSQQPPKVGQPYQPYPHQPNSNQLPANPNTTQYANPNNPNIPPNPYTAYPTGQPNAGAGLQGSPGSVAPPPYKRPRYEAGGSGTGYSGPNTHPTHGGYPPNPAPNHNLPPPALPPLRNQNSMAHSSPTPIRMGANTNSSHRGGFGGGGGRGPRTSGGAFGNNSPIRLNPGSVGTFDGTGAPHFDGSNHAHPPPHLPHPLPAHHQPPPAQHYQSNTFNNNSGANYSSHPTPHHGPNFNATNNADHSHSGPNHGTSTFAQPDTSYSSQPASNVGEHHYGFNDERGTSSRQGRGGFRGGGSGGRSARDRGSDYGGGGMRGPSSHSNNNGRGDRANNNSNNNARRPPNHHRYDDNNRLRASRSIQNLSTPPGKPERRNNGRFSNPPIGGGNGNGPRAGGGGRRGKFEEGRTQSNHRTPRVGTTQQTTGGASGSGSGPSGTSTRVRNGWGAQFKEFGEREKVQEKKEEVAPAKRTLTDFRINALEMQELNWSWLAESSDPTPVVSTTVEESKSQAVGSKHGRDESGGDHSPAHSSSTVTATATTKKVKSEASVELAKKIDEEAASAVKGLNLTVTDDQVSEQGESDEVKAQLLHTPTATTTTTTGPVVTDEPQQRERERVHSYSKPTIPAGRENSRLRLYFSSPTVEPLPAPPGLPSKPMMTPMPMLTPGGGGQGGKRKLSISAHSAMSVDTRIGGRGSSPMVNVNKAPRVATVEPSEVAEVKAGTKESEKEVKELEIEPTTSTEETQTNEKETTSITDGTTKDDQPVAPPAPSTDPKPADGPAPGGAEQSRHEEEDADEDADGDYEEEDEDYEGPPVPEPQPDRLSISYARNTRRMVIDADVVEWIKVYRAEHKIEVMLRLVPAVIQGGKYDGEMDEYRVCKGVLVEALDQEIDDYVIIDRATLEATWNAEESKPKVKSESESPMKKSVNGEDAGAVEEAEDEENEEVIHDPLLPPLHRLFKAIGGEEEGLKVAMSFKQDMILVVARLDTANPLTEAKWVRTGDVDSWISQMTGRIFKPEDKTECGWRRKITVVDPDPPPTIQHLLDTWLTTSTLGSIDTRQRFIDRHVIKNVDIIIEILLRVVRSGHTNPHHPMPLIVQQAATLHAPYPEQQTQVSLAVLGLYRLSIETALEGGVPMEKVVKKATDIVRSLPYRLAFSALDGIYKDETPS